MPKLPNRKTALKYRESIADVLRQMDSGYGCQVLGVFWSGEDEYMLEGIVRTESAYSSLVSELRRGREERGGFQADALILARYEPDADIDPLAKSDDIRALMRHRAGNLIDIGHFVGEAFQALLLDFIIVNSDGQWCSVLEETGIDASTWCEECQSRVWVGLHSPYAAEEHRHDCVHYRAPGVDLEPIEAAQS